MQSLIVDLSLDRMSKPYVKPLQWKSV